MMVIFEMRGFYWRVCGKRVYAPIEGKRESTSQIYFQKGDVLFSFPIAVQTSNKIVPIKASKIFGSKIFEVGLGIPSKILHFIRPPDFDKDSPNSSVNV